MLGIQQEEKLEQKNLREESNHHKQNGEKKLSFEQLLDHYEYERPRRGDILEGEIVYTSNQDVMLDVGVKRDAFVSWKDIEELDHRYQKKIKPGNLMPVYIQQVYSRDGDLIGSIKKGFEHKDWEEAQEILDSGEIATVQVIAKNRGGLLAQFGTLRGFIPRSHLVRGKDYFYNSDTNDEPLPCLKVKVIEVDRNKRRLILSEKMAFKEQLDEILKDFFEGQVITAWVKRVLDYGVFFDIKGIDGFMHISEIDWGWVEDPSNFFTEGEQVEVFVKEIDHDRKRIRLSRKALLPLV